MHHFINDYQEVNTATRSGEFIDPKSKLDVQFAELAASLLNKPIVETSSKRKFLEFLSAPTQALVGRRSAPSRCTRMVAEPSGVRVLRSNPTTVKVPRTSR